MFLTLACISISDHKHTHTHPLVIMSIYLCWNSMYTVIHAAKLSGRGADVAGGAYGDIEEGGSVNL